MTEAAPTFDSENGSVVSKGQGKQKITIKRHQINYNKREKSNIQTPYSDTAKFQTENYEAKKGKVLSYVGKDDFDEKFETTIKQKNLKHPEKYISKDKKVA